MVVESPGMILKTIGIVRNKLKEPANPDFDYSQVVSEIVIDPSLSEALDNLDEFSHIIVLYWLHKAVTSQIRTKVHVKGREELPLVGLFATRSPHRPNPIGKTTVKLLRRKGNVLEVAGLDAIDGTPVIDIKPYIPGGDSPGDARVPQWITS